MLLFREIGLRNDVDCNVQAKRLFTLYDVNITKVLGVATHEDRKRIRSSNYGVPTGSAATHGCEAGRNNRHTII